MYLGGTHAHTNIHTCAYTQTSHTHIQGFLVYTHTHTKYPWCTHTCTDPLHRCFWCTHIHTHNHIQVLLVHTSTQTHTLVPPGAPTLTHTHTYAGALGAHTHMNRPTHRCPWCTYMHRPTQGAPSTHTHLHTGAPGAHNHTQTHTLVPLVCEESLGNTTALEST